MSAKMNLRKQILLGYLAPLVLTVAASAAVYWTAEDLTAITGSVELAQRIVDASDDAHLHFTERQRAARGYLLLKNDTSRKNADQAAAALQEDLATLSQFVKDSVQLGSLQEISVATSRVNSVTDSIIAQVDAGNTAKGMELFATGDQIQGSLEVDALMDSFQKRQKEILAARAVYRDALIARQPIVVMTATLLAVSLSALLGLWIAARVSRSISESIAGMSTSSTEIAATVDEHERTVTQQSVAVSQTTSTIEELGASSRQSASQAESMAAAAKQSLEATQDGVRLANQVSASMADMKIKVSSVAEQILRLSEQAGQIGGIAKVVGELASETNMLALNAAVEAAHAGENGKGFAVVAAEIRKLAEQSKKSAERTNALVAEIQKATNSAVMVTEEGTRTAGEVESIIDRTIEAFGSISTTASNVSVSAQQLLLNSRQQAGALGQVTEAMQSLAAASAQMAAGTEQTRKGVQKLNRVALDLKAMV